MKLQISENIRTLRKQHGLMQDQLAEALGVSTAAVSKWERGTATPELGFIAQMAEIFEVSIDVLVGYEVQGGSKEVLERRIKELARLKEFDEASEVAETALAKYPNDFTIVYGCASLYEIKGAELTDTVSYHRAIELYNRAIILLSQNTNPEITEFTLQKEMAQCYLGLEQIDKGIEILKKYNLYGMNDALIGMLYATRKMYKPQEAEVYLLNAFSSRVTELMQTMLGYHYYYKRMGLLQDSLMAADWVILFLEELKVDKTKISYFDKLICLFYASKATVFDLLGETKLADEQLKKAWDLSDRFDANPDNGPGNVLFVLGDTSDITLFDDVGVSVTEAIERKILVEEDNERLLALWRDWKQA